jgi:acetolactate synthase I/II/III large subunit
MKLSDYVVSFLINQGINDVFLVPGGGNMHLIDSIGRSEKIRYICNHHEQASSMAAEGYSRLKNNIGVAFVTSGPGGTNAITGVAGSWLDSIPILIISGQVKLPDTIYNNKGLRQFGDQEINIIDIVKPITKYAVMVTEKNEIRYHLEKAFYLAKSGRPGPVWIDIPLDIQSTQIAEDELIVFEPGKDIIQPDNKIVIGEIISLLKKSKRPLFILGNGIRLSHAESEIMEVLNILKVPAVTSINGVDLVNEDYKYYIGRPGVFGQRGANFAIQNCDLLISIGSRLMLRQIGFNYKMFAREAIKIIVDIDENELNKKSLNANIKICYDARKFINDFLKILKSQNILIDNLNEWKEKCVYWKEKYNKIEPQFSNQEEYVNSYYFIDKLNNFLSKEDHIITSVGTAKISTLFAIKIKSGQRLITNKSLAAMGYGLPAAIGACVANGRKQVICIENDGSLQFNIQELQTVVHYELPIKIFVFNNNGYLSIKITQKNYFPGNLTAADPSTGVSFPDLKKMAKAYNIPFIRINNKNEINKKLKKVFNNAGCIICEIMMDPWQDLVPKVKSVQRKNGMIVSKTLEDMYPFLDREEYRANMIVKPVDEE